MAALPFLFLTVTSYSYVGLPPGKSGQASALINVARNLGGSIGVSASQTLLAWREQFHQSRLAEDVYPSSLAYARTLRLAAADFAHHGTSTADAQHQAIAWIGQALANQAQLMSYADVFAASVLVRAAARPGRLSAAARQPRRLASCAGLALNAEPLGQSARASANAEAKRSRPGAQGSGRTIRQPSAPSRIS